MARPRPPISIRPIETTMNQLSGVRVPRTTPLILSVIEPKVWPGSMSGEGAYVAGLGLIMGRSRGAAGRLQFGIRVAERGEIGRPRTRVEVLEQPVIALERFQLR